MNWDGAACHGKDPDLFFPGTGDYAQTLEARAVCLACSLRSACLEYALREGEAGIWGGTTEHQRRTMGVRVQRPPGDRERVRRDVARLLNTRTLASAGDIAVQLGVSTRTVERVRALLKDSA